MFRIGHGYDAHTFEINKPLVLGGVTISHSHGMKAHSDGDVIIHAICDALLGACALGDIGQHFPDQDASYANANSRLFLRSVLELVRERKYTISNLDVTVLAEAPKLAPYIPLMRTLLAEDLTIEVGNINIKATTTEKMGFVGRKEGIACYAVALLAISERE
jgi:2-C-methyl-D-erythritol 2,4-cyclodiphosphate synthase